MGVALGGEAFSAMSSDRLVTELKAAVHDVLGR